MLPPITRDKPQGESQLGGGSSKWKEEHGCSERMRGQQLVHWDLSWDPEPWANSRKGALRVFK